MKQLTIASNSIMLNKAFTFGVATSSFQIEGGRYARQTNIWDTFCAKSGAIADGSNGDDACQHTIRWKEDIELVESLNVDAYRFSIAWGRVMHEDGTLNHAGIQLYIDILDTLKSKNIKAFVTLYHWDLPQYLEDNGGWLNRDTAYAFAHYVDIVTKQFGNRVFSYATLNEPWCSAYLGYEIGIHAPGKLGKQYGKKAAHHLLLAHGLAMQVLKENSPNSQNGIVLNFSPTFAASANEGDLNAAKLADEHFNQWYIKPLFDKQYPDIINELPEEHKPEICPGDMDIISQSLDFIGINYYSRSVFTACSHEGFALVEPDTLLVTDMGWEIYPQGLTQLLVDLNHRYALPKVYITENGAAMSDKLVDGEVHDLQRVQYLQTHLDAVNDAILQGVDIHGYFAWSLMDNFEWAEGYLKRFGIIYVDYETQKRTLKESAKQYTNMLEIRK
jgi:beta-glucosidase